MSMNLFLRPLEGAHFESITADPAEVRAYTCVDSQALLDHIDGTRLRAAGTYLAEAWETPDGRDEIERSLEQLRTFYEEARTRDRAVLRWMA